MFTMGCVAITVYLWMWIALGVIVATDPAAGVAGGYIWVFGTLVMVVVAGGATAALASRGDWVLMRVLAIMTTIALVLGLSTAARRIGEML